MDPFCHKICIICIHSLINSVYKIMCVILSQIDAEQTDKTINKNLAHNFCSREKFQLLVTP